jgi:hypothetical protein
VIDLPLTATERRAFDAALISSRRMRARLEVFDRDENPLGELKGKLAGGAVQIDATAEIRRSLSISLVDERRLIRFEPASPTDGAVHADNFISASYGVYVPATVAREYDLSPFWTDVPVFYGPITLFERHGAEATLEAQGKESLGLAPHYAGRAFPIRKGSRTDDAIKLAARRMGEEKFLLPDMPRRLNRTRGVGPKSEIWKVIRGGEETAKGKLIPGLIAKGGADMEPYYNARGELTARSKGGNSRFTFREGEHLTDEPTIRYNVAEFRNTVDVSGAKKKGKAKAHARESLPPSHPLSPQSLARNGEPRYLVEWVEADGLKTDAECARRARSDLARLSREGVDASFDTLVVPHLEEDDEVTLETADFSLNFPAREMTIPLTAGETMTVGATKRVTR